MTIMAAAVTSQRNMEMLIRFFRVYVTEPAPIEASEFFKELRLQIRVLKTHSSQER